jgi:hypothetical protein
VARQTHTKHRQRSSSVNPKKRSRAVIIMPPKIHDPSLKDSTLWQLLNKGQVIDKKYRKSVGKEYGKADANQVSPDHNNAPAEGDGSQLRSVPNPPGDGGTTGQEADRSPGEAGSQRLAAAPLAVRDAPAAPSLVRRHDGCWC